MIWGKEELKEKIRIMECKEKLDKMKYFFEENVSNQ